MIRGGFLTLVAFANSLPSIQLAAMTLGGNGKARAYFKKHGVADMHTKTEKKYASKAAKGYRGFLAELVADSNPQAIVGQEVLVEEDAGVQETSTVPGVGAGAEGLAPGFTSMTVSVGLAQPKEVEQAKPKVSARRVEQGAELGVRKGALEVHFTNTRFATRS